MNINWNHYRSWLQDVIVGDIFPVMPPPTIGLISTDSRTLKEGDWFIPLRGATFDGHEFIKDALNKKVAGFFYELDRIKNLSEKELKHGVPVKNTLTALQRIAHHARFLHKTLKVIALTGSTGKTTTRELTAALFSSIGPTFSAAGSYNNEIGVPLTLLKLTDHHKYVVLEFGARHEGDISFLSKLATPDVVACLNIGSAHLGEFGSVEKIAKTKLEIFTDSAPGAALVAFCDDDRIITAAKRSGKKFVSFGCSCDADVSVRNVELARDSASAAPQMIVRFEIYKREYLIRFSFAHSAYPINLAAAAAIALASGVSVEKTAQAMSLIKIENIGGGGRFHTHKKGSLTIIDDAYNANPDSMTAGLKTLAELYKDQKKIVILGDMLELGPTSSELHKKIGVLCASMVCPEMIITVGDEAEHIKLGAIESGFSEKAILSFKNVDELIKANLPFQFYGDVVYAKASNAVKLPRFVDDLLKRCEVG